MSALSAVLSTVKSLAVPSALIAVTVSALDALGVPAVPVKTSTLPASASAGALLSAKTASRAPKNAQMDRIMRPGGASVDV